MKVETLPNGQFQVTHNNLTLIQTVINGQRFNECSVKYADYSELVDQNSPEFRELFIELHNYKNS